MNEPLQHFLALFQQPLTASWSHLAAAVPLVLASFVATIALYRLTFHPLAGIPGPFWARISDFWKAYHAAKGDYATALEKAHQQYGERVRIGPNDISLTDPAAVKVLYGHKSEYKKGPFYENWSMAGVPNHFSERDPVAHASRRRQVANVYSMNTLVTLEEFCDECSERLSRLMDQASQTKSTVDLAQLLLFYAFDVVGEIAFGQSFGLLEEGKDHGGRIETLGAANIMLAVVSTMNAITWLFCTKPMVKLSLAAGDKGPGLILNYSAKLLDRRIEQKARDPEGFDSRKDMMYRFMTTRDPGTGKELNYEQLHREAITLVVAGADTTATTIRAFIGYAFTHPPTLKRLQEEVDEAYSAGRISIPISYKDAAKLEFHQACIKEAMRIHPAVQMPMQRVVPKGGREVAGHWYPGGTYLGISPRELHRDERAYGKDAKEWNPQRWIDGDRSELEAYNLAFGAGPRVCLGRNISLMEMAKLMPMLTLKYNFKFANPAKPYKVHESWFAVQQEGFATVEKRSDSPYYA